MYLFKNFAFAIQRFIDDANQLLRDALERQESFDLTFFIFRELIEAAKMLSDCFSTYLLACIGAQFVMTLNLLYTLFIAINGSTVISLYLALSSIFWIIYSIIAMATGVNICEQCANELLRANRILSGFNVKDIENLESVSRAKISEQK